MSAGYSINHSSESVLLFGDMLTIVVSLSTVVFSLPTRSSLCQHRLLSANTVFSLPTPSSLCQHRPLSSNTVFSLPTPSSLRQHRLLSFTRHPLVIPRHPLHAHRRTLPSHPCHRFSVRYKNSPEHRHRSDSTNNSLQFHPSSCLLASLLLWSLA